MRFPLLVLCVLWCLAAPAFPWGAEGHRAIAEAARGMLTPEAREKIVKILGNDDLAAISTWLDDVRLAGKHHTGPLKNDPEAKEFNAKFPKNDEWHYVDLPVGTAMYSEDAFFASKDDVVHAIHHAVDVLEGRESDMTDQQALRVLVHLVGDVHQPLHCAAGYYDVSDPAQPKLIGDIRGAMTKPHDRGGNQLFYSKSLQLHAFWDNEIVKDLIRAAPEKPLAQQLTDEVNREKWATEGDYHQSAVEWVLHSAVQAKDVYQGFTFGPATLKPDGSIDRIEITLPDGFWQKQKVMAKTQMAKAAVHLASLLNSIRLK